MRIHSIAALLALSAALHAQQPAVFTTGLIHPAKIIPGPSGSLLVAEAGDKANTGRVSFVSSNGTRQTLIDSLPAGPTTEDADGPTGIVLDGDNTLFLAIGEGDQLAAGPTAGTMVPNPKGPSSPILASILKITFSQPVDKIAAPFSFRAADHNTLADGGTVTLSNGPNGATATINVLSDFRYRPDPVQIYRNSHPYALTRLPNDPNTLYMADAGLNSIVQIDSQTGRWKTITKFPQQPNKGTTPPPMEDAVPDSIRPFNGQLLVTLLTGFPFTPGNSKVMMVDPSNGSAQVVAENLSAAIDIVPRTRFFRPTEYLVLEYSSDFRANGPGRVRRVFATSSDVIVDNLNRPSSMSYDATAGILYIASRADGTILKVVLAN